MDFEVNDILKSSFDAPLTRVAPSRFERKAAEKKGRTPSKTPSADRFIPNRSAMDFEVSHLNLSDQENCNPASPAKEEAKKNLADALLDGREKAKILAFKTKAPAPEAGYQNNLRVLYTQNKLEKLCEPKKANRNIPQCPERILDAPEMVDDYYLNLLDWNAENMLAVALGKTIYLWNAGSGSITQLMETSQPDDYVTSVSWIQQGNILAVGTNQCSVQLWDVTKQKQLREMRGHTARVGSLAWNSHILSSGSRDSNIHNHDVRIAQHLVSTFAGHQQEICGLKWSTNGTQLASGGNDNILNIWEMSRQQPRFTMDHHMAAVKALAWCPWQRDLLASGGGTADRTIKFWNTTTGALLNSVDTKSQVCGLMWSRNDKELLSAHGFSQNQLTVWKYPTMTRVAELTGHTARVLHLAMSPDGSTVCSAAADETLRFWRCFSAPESKATSKGADGAGAFSTRSIR
eukprot:tig00020961_g16632.t1